MAKANAADVVGYIPVELTAPSIQRLARKGLGENLSDEERMELCACVVFHIDNMLEQRRIPKALKRRIRPAARTPTVSGR